MEYDQDALEANDDAPRPQALRSQLHHILLENLDRLVGPRGVGDLDDRHRSGRAGLPGGDAIGGRHEGLRNSDRPVRPA